MNTSQTADFVEFRVLDGNSPTYTTFGYTDKKGFSQKVYEGVDMDNKPVKKKFSFQDGYLRIHKDNETDIEFLRNHSHCLGSPNCGGNAIFREYDLFQEIRKQEASAMTMAQAIEIAASIQGVKAERLGLMLGMGASATRAQLIIFAQKNPDGLLYEYNRLNAPEVKTRAVLRKGISNGAIQRTSAGFLSWNNVTLGANEDSAVEFLHRKDQEPIREELTRSVQLTDEMEATEPSEPAEKKGQRGQKKVSFPSDASAVDSFLEGL